MATSPLKLTDLLKLQPYPAGGFTIANSTPAPLATPVMGNDLSRYLTPGFSATAPTMAKPVMGNDLSRYLTPGFSATSAARAPSAPIPTTAPTPAPVAPPAPAPTPKVPPQWLNPDGTFKTPDQVAQEAGAALKSSAQAGDVGRLSASEFGPDNLTTEQQATQTRRVANTRNDIASGETDPYKIASQSGIAYTPAELNAIEHAYAGVYDPALDSAMSKLQAKQTADAEAAKAQQAADIAAENAKNDLVKLAKEHDYDMEKMQADQKFQYGLAAYKSALDAKSKAADAAGGISSYINENQNRSVDQAGQLLQTAINNPKIFGRSAAVPIPDFLRSDEFRNYNADLTSLKSSISFGELSAMRADSKTGGALGQVSDTEGKKLEAALGALDMSQTPENVQKNLRQIIDSINKYREAKGIAPVASAYANGGSGENLPVAAGTDGASYGFPGYHSDGTQWVANE